MIEIPMVERHHEEGLYLRYAPKTDCFDTHLLYSRTMQSRVAIARPGRERLPGARTTRTLGSSGISVANPTSAE